MNRQLLLLLAALAMPTTAADPCTAGIDQVRLLVRGVNFLKGQAAGGVVSNSSSSSSPNVAPKTLRVSLATNTLFVGFGDGVQSLTFPAGEGSDPKVQNMGNVPRAAAAGQQVWSWIRSAARWIHADVAFDADAQRSILVVNAHCFGQSGREAIVDGNMQLSKTTAFLLDQVQLDLTNNVVVWDFDVVDRASCTVSGRGTDFVRMCTSSGGQVYRVDTVRHQDGAQPEWVQRQVDDPFTLQNATCNT
jgi:hypothetical protein